MAQPRHLSGLKCLASSQFDHFGPFRCNYKPVVLVLMLKLRALGITGLIFKWIEN
jgi:hypothetical protein